MQVLRQSTAVDVLIGPFVDSADGVTPETGLTLSQADIKLSKNGQALAQKNDNTAAAHDDEGYYNCELDATDTNTVGTLVLIVNESGALPVRHEFQVVEEAVYDSIFASGAGTLATAAALATVDANVDAILVDTDTTIPGLITTVDTVVDGIKAVTDNLPDSGALTSIAQEATLGTPADGDLATDIANLHGDVTTMDGVVDALVADIGTNGAGLTAIPWNSAWDAEVQSEAADALNAYDPPTKAELDSGLAGLNDPTAAEIRAEIDSNSTQLAAIVEDTGTTLPATLTTIDTVVDGIKAVTDNLPDSGALTTIDGNIDAILVDTGTTLPGTLSDIETDTQDIQSRLPAALSDGRMAADVEAISGSTDAADNLEASALGIIRGAAATGTLSTTQMTTDLTGYDDDRLIGRVIVFTSAPLAGEATEITDYASSGGLLTFTEITESPTNGTTFVIG